MNTRYKHMDIVINDNISRDEKIKQIVMRAIGGQNLNDSLKIFEDRWEYETRPKDRRFTRKFKGKLPKCLII